MTDHESREEINVAMTLLPHCRTSGDAARAQQLATKLGFQPTTSGAATLSFRIDRTVFERIFGAKVRTVESVRPDEKDHGAPRGHAVDEDLKIPEELADLIQCVSVIPPARRLSSW
jgi:hypothetical protein